MHSVSNKCLAAAGAAVIMSITACVTSQVLIGKPGSPLSPEQVQLFLEPPAKKYQEIAVIDTSSKHSWAFTAEGKADVVIRRLKEEAAKLGANAVVLQDIADVPLGSFGTGVGTDLTGAHGTVSLGIFGESVLSHKFGRGMAIHIE